jgi:uncharacterized protein YjiK
MIEAGRHKQYTALVVWRTYCCLSMLAWGCSGSSGQAAAPRQGGSSGNRVGGATEAESSRVSSSVAGTAGASLGGAAGGDPRSGQGGTTSTTTIAGNSGGLSSSGVSTSKGGTSAGGSRMGGGTGTVPGSTGGASAIGGASTRSSASSFGGTAGAGPASSTSTSAGGASSSRSGGSGGASSKGGATAFATPLNSYARVQGPITLEGIDNASGVAWKPESDTFFIVSNSTHALYEYPADFKTRLRTVALTNGPTDTEDVVYLGSNRFAVVDEENQVHVVTILDGATSVNMGAADVERYVVSAPPATVNRGFEGVAFRPDLGTAGQLIVCQEGGVAGTPIRVLFFDRRTSPGTSSYADGTLAVREPWNALSKLGALATDLAAVSFDSAGSTLLVLSQETSRLLRVVPETGEVLDQRDLKGSPQYEGVTLAGSGRLVLVSEPNFVEVYRAN